MLKTIDIDALERKVYQLLEEVGIAVENDDLSEICFKQGCSPGNDHRIKIPRKVISEMVEFQ